MCFDKNKYIHVYKSLNHCRGNTYPQQLCWYKLKQMHSGETKAQALRVVDMCFNILYDRSLPNFLYGGNV